MGLIIDYDDSSINTEFGLNDEEVDIEISEHQRDVRRKLEERLERKRLKQELEDYEGELDGEFEWNED